MKIKKIYGAPGTGKTTRMLDLLQEEAKRTPLERIAFVTHTVAAKVEAKERIQKVMSITDEKKQLKYFRTIHGICYVENDLKRDNVMQPRDYLLFGDSVGIPFSSNFTNDYDIDGLPIGYNLSGGNEILAVRQFAAAQCLMVCDVKSAWPIWISPSLMREVVVGYAKWKENNAKFDFVDMLYMYEEYGEPLDIDVMFIDEAQDLSKFQWKIVDKMMAKADRVFMAGDDDQAIYGFIGADRYGFLEQKCDEVEILPTTYRLLENIWMFAQNIISGVSKRQDKKIGIRDKGGLLDYYNADLLYLDIDSDKSTMIIARHHNQLQRLVASLEARGIPYKGKGREVYRKEQTLAVHAYFRAKQGDHISLREAATILKYIGNPVGAKKLRKEQKENIQLCINAAQLTKEFAVNFETTQWPLYIARNRAEFERNELIRSILNNVGLSGLVDEPKVSLSTYHGSKGREADRVILLTDCYRNAWYSAMQNPDDERRLSYVGATRAREHLTIVAPETDMWMRSLI